MVKVNTTRPSIRTVSANVEENTNGVFVVKAKVEKIICCGLVKKRTALMILISFLAFGLVAIVGIGFQIIGRL